MNAPVVTDETIALVVLASDTSLEELMAMDSPAFLAALKKVLEDADTAPDIVAGFQSAV